MIPSWKRIDDWIRSVCKVPSDVRTGDYLTALAVSVLVAGLLTPFGSLLWALIVVVLLSVPIGRPHKVVNLWVRAVEPPIRRLRRATRLENES